MIKKPSGLVKYKSSSQLEQQGIVFKERGSLPERYLDNNKPVVLKISTISGFIEETPHAENNKL
jgi:hypothetical protein